jgi:hypothetical protein
MRLVNLVAQQLLRVKTKRMRLALGGGDRQAIIATTRAADTVGTPSSSSDLHLRVNRFGSTPPATRAASGHAAAAPSSVMNARPFHSITSLAATSRPGGTVRPIALAVLRLTTVSNLVAACTGRSAGLSPRRMRST